MNEDGDLLMPQARLDFTDDSRASEEQLPASAGPMNNLNGIKTAFGSLVPLALPDGFIYILVSVVTKHTALLLMIPRCDSPHFEPLLNPISAPNPYSKPLHWSHF